MKFIHATARFELMKICLCLVREQHKLALIISELKTSILIRYAGYVFTF